MATINELKWQTLTAAINEIKSPNQFCRRLLFPDATFRTIPTEDIELSVLTKGREIAPFVRKNGEGIMVQGTAAKFQTVSAPNIRIKIPFTPSELLYGREPGTVIFQQTASGVASGVQQHIARDLAVLESMIVNAEEYLACKLALEGAVTYSTADEEVFQITVPRDASTNITLSTFWDDADPTTVRILTDIHSAKKVMSDLVGLNPTDVILGSEAETAFLKLVESGNVKTLDIANANSGTVDFTTQFQDDGAIFLGRVSGLNFWSYSRTASLNGSSVDMVRAKYAEFITRSRAADRVLYYGAIPDVRTFRGRLFQARRFAKSWEQEDPSVMWSLVHSRPLPFPRRPDSTVSMKVVSG